LMISCLIIRSDFTSTWTNQDQLLPAGKLFAHSEIETGLKDRKVLDRLLSVY
jgi:hypothetical protein